MKFYLWGFLSSSTTIISDDDVCEIWNVLLLGEIEVHHMHSEWMDSDHFFYCLQFLSKSFDSLGWKKFLVHEAPEYFVLQ